MGVLGRLADDGDEHDTSGPALGCSAAGASTSAAPVALSKSEVSTCASEGSVAVGRLGKLLA